jgi:hypothetical protein
VPAQVPSTPRSSTGGTPANQSALQLSGGVQGFLNVLSVTCSRTDKNVLVAIKGRVENALYGVEIAAPRTGAYQIGGASLAAASVRLSSQTPADPVVSRWSAGIDGVAGAGDLTLTDGGGVLDADLQGLAGTRGSVHVRGSWSCR